MSFTEVTDGQGVLLSSTASTTVNLHPLGPNAQALDQQTHPGDSDYQILPTDRYVSTDQVLSGARTWRLPAANSVTVGWQVTVADSFGACNASMSLTVAPSGSDTIRLAPAAKLCNSPYAYVKVRSDGVSNWTIVDQFPPVSTPVSDTDYQLLTSDSYVYTTVPFTAARTWTLPAASTTPIGWQVTVADAAAACANPYSVVAARTLTIAPSGTDTIGAIAASRTITNAYGFLTVRSDGISNWTVVTSAPTDGWIADTSTWTYLTPTAFTVAGVDASYLPKGTKVSYNDGSVDYGHVASTVTVAGVTTVTLIANSDYSIANATLTAPRYSYADNPQGFPSWFNWGPGLSGWSANPTNAVYRYSINGSAIALNITQITNGTSNNVTHTATLPVNAATITNSSWGNPGLYVDNNVVLIGYAVITSGGSTIALRAIAAGSNTASGNSRVPTQQITYEF